MFSICRKNCPAGHSSNDIGYRNFKNNINSNGICGLCTKEHFIQEFRTWSSGNPNIDKIIQETQLNDFFFKLQWIPYEKFQDIKHIANGGRGSVCSAELENGIKWYWNFNTLDWEFDLVNHRVALKEINDSSYDVVEILRVYMTVALHSECMTKYYGISKNPSTQNFIIVTELFDNDLNDFLTENFWDLGWETKIDILSPIVQGLLSLNEKDLVHCNFHSGNILIEHNFNFENFDIASIIDLDSCKFENDLIINSNNKNNIIYGTIPYIPPEVLRGNEYTREGNIYSFGGIMYEIITAQRPFADQAHDTYLMIDICNGVRPKVPDFMLNWIPEWYLNLMYRCWSDDPSERPTAIELYDLFCNVSEKLYNNVVNNNVMRQLKIADENQKNTSKSQKKEFLELFSHSNKLHSQSCYISRGIHTLHGLRDLLEDLKSGKSADPNLLLMNNELSTNIDGDPEIQSKQKNVGLGYDSQ
ncbi:hypothetical protein Glove_84g51 [Diversispora epigaea]|uniref:Protein kinase domain-containing protein n=1 Tax=Diversispora epigaea TaxID=1348612 RepID=A0A397JBR8_9GLOM|nr:hypothetical protein Glove_84g51 [Diversispora epigaea]